MDSSVEKIIEDVNNGMKNNMENLLSPIVEKLKASRERDMVIFNILQKMPEYINLIEENKKLKNLLSEKSNNEIKMDIIEKCNIGKTYSSGDLKESFQINNEFKNIKKNVQNSDYKNKYIELEEKLLRWDAKFSSFFERVSLSNPLYNEIYKLKAEYNKIFHDYEKKIYEQEDNVWREIPVIESWESKLSKNDNLISDSEDSECSEDQGFIEITKVKTLDDRLADQTAELELSKKINYIDCVEESEKRECIEEEEEENEEDEDNEEEEDEEEEEEDEEENEEKEEEEEDEEDEEKNEELSSDEEDITNDLLEYRDSENEEEEEFLVVDINSPEGVVKEYLTTNEQTGYIYILY